MSRPSSTAGQSGTKRILGHSAGGESREWEATAMTEERVVREMVRCLREIGEGTGA